MTNISHDKEEVCKICQVIININGLLIFNINIEYSKYIEMIGSSFTSGSVSARNVKITRLTYISGQLVPGIFKRSFSKYPVPIYNFSIFYLKSSVRTTSSVGSCSNFSHKIATSVFHISSLQSAECFTQQLDPPHKAKVYLRKKDGL